MKTQSDLPSDAADTQAVVENSASAFGSTVAEILKDVSGVKLSFSALSALQSEYMKQATALWNQTMEASSSPQPPVPPVLGDRRFAAPEWLSNPPSAFAAQLYLLNARTLKSMADSLEGEEKTRERIQFAVQQLTAAASPSNYLALNPEAMGLALATKGESISRGLQHLWDDLQQGHLSQTDERVFEVGHNLAVTPGHVVFENELFQLIEYTPQTGAVFERPLLIVPPCINKYYILDLQQDNSFIRYALEQGHRTFVVSWRNANDSMAQMTWDHYIEDAVIRAIGIVQQIADTKTISTLGFCIGGTLLATALAVLAARGEKPAASMTLLTTFLDFSNTGVLDLFVDEAMVQMRELTLGPASPNGGGVLKGRELAQTFSALRPNELVWNYVVGNYLKGETPPPFDLLYWNSDSTNLPGPMYCWYLRNTYLENKLMKPGGLTVCGQALDLGTIEAPAYVFGSREDHIVPWDSAYLNTHVLTGNKGNTRFVLGASGHIAGVVNPPAKKKRSYWVAAGNDALPASSTDWLATTKENAGSWWPDWSAWLKVHAGQQVAAPTAPGSRLYKPIEAAPGRYVKQKA